MHIITKRTLREFWEKHPESESPLRYWYSVAKNATWQNVTDVRTDFPHADLVGTCTIFNVGGNNYRLIVYLNYRFQKCYILHVLSHREYDNKKWQGDC